VPDENFHTADIPGTRTLKGAAKQLAWVSDLSQMLSNEVRAKKRTHPAIVQRVVQQGLDVNLAFDCSGFEKGGVIRPCEVGAVSINWRHPKLCNQSAVEGMVIVLAHGALLACPSVTQCCLKALHVTLLHYLAMHSCATRIYACACIVVQGMVGGMVTPWTQISRILAGKETNEMMNNNIFNIALKKGEELVTEINLDGQRIEVSWWAPADMACHWQAMGMLGPVRIPGM
jgi:hypothetical protein